MSEIKGTEAVEGFDPTKFLTDDASLVDAIVGDEPHTGDEPNEYIEDDDDDAFTLDDEDGEGDTPPVTIVEGGEPGDDSRDAIEETPDDAKGITPEAYTILATEIGIEAKDKQDFVTKVKESLKQVEDLKKELTIVKSSFEVGETAARIDSMIALPNEDLMRAELKAMGLNDEQVEKSFAELEETGQIDAYAAKVRIDLRASRAKFLNDAVTNKVQKEASEKEANDKFVNNVKEAMSKTEALFGTKIGKTKEESERIKNMAFEKYASGQFFNDLVGSPEKLSKMILWATLESRIEEKLENKGANRERRRILIDQMGNPSRPSNNGIVNTDAKVDGFDPKAFLEGLKK